MISLTAFQVKQYYYYEIMREQADEGREAALEAACRYAFLNSGISSKLKSCQLEDSSLCKDCEDNCDTDCRERCGSKGDYEDEEDYNDCMDACIEGELNCLVNDCQSQQAEFQLWLREDLEGVSSARYSWLDGQEREHEVSAAVNTQDVDSYKLKLTASPTAGLLALLYLALTEATTAQGSCNLCWCTATIVAAAAASIDGLLLATLAGLVPAWELDASAATMILFPICWISDINHDRLLDLTTWQEHEGEDYGSLGKTDYPHIESYSQVNFEDEGEIYYPNPYFDTSIIKTDAEK